MSKRYYVVDIAGDGSEENSFRPIIAEIPGVKFAGAIVSDNTTGQPLANWVLVVVETSNHGAVQSHPGVTSLPDFPLDGKVSAINNLTRIGMVNALRARGIDTVFISTTDGYREVIRGIGQTLDPSFDENNFDVA